MDLKQRSSGPANKKIEEPAWKCKYIFSRSPVGRPFPHQGKAGVK